MKIGLIGRADLSGLGYMTRDFCDHLPVEKALIVSREGRGPNSLDQILARHRMMTSNTFRQEDIEFLFDGIDVLVGFETFYHPDVIPEAVARGIKVAMFPMWECSPPEVCAADYLFCVTDRERARFPYRADTIRVDWPMEPPPGWKQQARQRPLRVVACAGSGGLHDRNNVESLKALRQAADAGRADGWTFDLREFSTDRSRWAQYANADLFVHLQAFHGLSLPLLEAAACGVPCVVLDIPGFREEYTSSCRVGVGAMFDREMMGERVTFARPDPSGLIRTINRLAYTVQIPPAPRPGTWAEFVEIWTKHVGPLESAQ